MPDINAGQPIRFEDGGKITIREQGGGTDYTVLNVLEGTLTFTMPVRASLPRDVDRGVIQPNRRRGNQQSGSLAFDVKWTGATSANELLTLLLAEGSLATGYLPAYEIEVEIYKGPNGAGAGTTLLFENCSRDEAPTVSAGAEYDTLQARFDCTKFTPTAIIPSP